MGDFGALSCTKSSGRPKSTPIWTPGGRNYRCQRHRGLNDQPTAEADTFGLGMQHWGPAHPRSASRPGAARAR